MRPAKNNPLKNPQPALRSGGLSGETQASARRSGFPLAEVEEMSWRLPSGVPLAEFALRAGFLAPQLWQARPPRGGVLKARQGGFRLGLASVREWS